MPVISVIVPVFNAERYLRCCVDSILAQTFTDFELLLINDGSTDGSKAICDDYVLQDTRVRVFHKVNGGVSSARNIGLSNAAGEYVSFVDSDDWLEPSMLYEVYNKAKCNEADLVFVDINYRYTQRQLTYQTYRWIGKPQDALLDYLKQSRSCPGWGLIKRSVIDKEDSRFPENLTIYEDFHLLVRLVYQASVIAKVENPLYNYRMQEESIVHTTAHSRTIQDQVWAYNSILDYFKSHGVYEMYAPSLYDRILYDYQRLALDAEKHSKFCEIYPDKKYYILHSTTINFKLKVLMWCITHHLSFIAYVWCGVRNFLKAL